MKRTNDETQADCNRYPEKAQPDDANISTTATKKAA